MRRTNRKSIIKNTIENYIETNAKTLIVLVIIFLIGLSLGIISINNLDENNKIKISEYIFNFIQNVKENVEISNENIFRDSIKNSIYTVLILWFLGSTVIGMPLIFIVIMYKGYSIGYTMAAIIATLGVKNGMLFIMSTMVLKYIIYIPCILIIAISGIKLYKTILEDRRKENIKVKILKHTALSFSVFFCLILVSILEANVLVNVVKFITKYL